MSAAYVTHGTAYHLDSACPRMVHGELLWDSDSDENWWIAGGYRSEVISTQYAAACGKWPCLHCVPAEQRVFPPLYGQTFGHEPIGGLVTVCRRCTIDVAYWTGAEGENDGWEVHPTSVTWPCTSAVVLGLVPRCPDCGWGIDVPGARKCASCEQDDRFDALGAAL